MREARRVLIFTGDGKGKTTAALGMALRASGHGMRTLVLQFIKDDPQTGEVKAVERLPGVEVVQAGRGFVPPPDDPKFAEHRREAGRALRLASEALGSGKYDLVILDEVCLAVEMGLLEEESVVEAVERAGGGVCVVMTGRGATPGLISLADTVTEMRCIKHAFQEGRAAEKGVEY